MPLANYSDLVDEIDDWLHRSDLTSKIPTFIKLGENYLNRKVKTKDMETVATATASTSSRYMALPDDFVEMSALWIQSPRSEIEYVAPPAFNELVVSETATGTPAYYTLKDEIVFDVIPASAFTIETEYLKKYDLATDSTNWLMTNNPDLYLNATMIQALIYIQDDGRAQSMKANLDEMIAFLNRQEAKKRKSSNGTLRVDGAIISNGSFNILTG